VITNKALMCGAMMAEGDLSRREVITGLISIGGAMVINGTASATSSPPKGAADAAASSTSQLQSGLLLQVNGAQYKLTAVDVNTTLLDCLRDDLQLTGTKKGCGLGHCGACTVLIDGRRVTSCLTLAVMQQGKQITTIEGLSTDGALHPVQAAFIEHDGYQCGYCTPGQIMSAVACIAEGHAASDADVREWMSGNICRCGAYTNIVAAVRFVAQRGA